MTFFDQGYRADSAFGDELILLPGETEYRIELVTTRDGYVIPLRPTWTGDADDLDSATTPGMIHAPQSEPHGVFSSCGVPGEVSTVDAEVNCYGCRWYVDEQQRRSLPWLPPAGELLAALGLHDVTGAARRRAELEVVIGSRPSKPTRLTR